MGADRRRPDDTMGIAAATMDARIFNMLWVTAELLFLVSAVVVLLRLKGEHGRWEAGSMAVAVLAHSMPLATLVLYLWVARAGGFPTEAPAGGEAGVVPAWIWTHVWASLLFSSPVALVLSVIAAAMPPYPPRHLLSFLCRLCGAAAATCAWLVLFERAPGG